MNCMDWVATSFARAFSLEEFATIVMRIYEVPTIYTLSELCGEVIRLYSLFLSVYRGLEERKN